MGDKIKKLANILWNEPLVILSVLTSIPIVLVQQHLIAAWIPLLVLAVATPIQRSLVTPNAKSQPSKPNPK